MSRSGVFILDELYDVVAPEDKNVKYRVAEILPGWIRTHTVGGSHPRYYICKEVDDEGRRLVLLGTRAASECAARFGVEPLWVGQCTYAVYARFKGG